MTALQLGHSNSIAISADVLRCVGRTGLGAGEGKAICLPGSQPAEVLCKLCLDPRILQRNGGMSPVRTVCWSILPNIFERVVSFSEV